MQMRTFTRVFLTASLLFVPATALFAQAAVDPSGHWTGAIHVPPFNGAGSREVAIDIDLAKNATGVLDGTFGQPGQNVKGLPLSKVALEGRTVSFELKATTGGGLFRASLSDATSMTGEFVTSEGGYTIPFDLKRTGEAQIAPAPRSAAIGKELEGTWNGTIDVNGKQERLVLKMANRGDGTATGTILDLDGSAVEIPIAMTLKASTFTLEVPAVGASYVAELRAGNELVGTWTQGPVNLPLTFTRGTK
jgi:hypothetical protein